MHTPHAAKGALLQNVWPWIDPEPIAPSSVYIWEWNSPLGEDLAKKKTVLGVKRTASGEEGKTAPPPSAPHQFWCHSMPYHLSRFVIPWFPCVFQRASTMSASSSHCSSKYVRCECFKPERCDPLNANLIQPGINPAMMCCSSAILDPENQVIPEATSKSCGHWCSCRKSSRRNGILHDLTHQVVIHGCVWKWGVHTHTHPNFGRFFFGKGDDQPMDFACHLTHLDEYHLETFMQLYTPKVEHVNVRNAQEEGTSFIVGIIWAVSLITGNICSTSWFICFPMAYHNPQ